MDSNPALKVKLPKAQSHDLGKQPFSGEQIALILKRMVDDLRVEFQWLIKLMAYHGCRSGEIADLRCKDVTVVRNIHVMRIYGEIKNPESRRDVPLHPKIRADFLAYVAKVAKKGEFVFQDLPIWKGGRESKFQKDCNLWLRKIGIEDRKLTLHSFRHAWITQSCGATIRMRLGRQSG